MTGVLFNFFRGSTPLTSSQPAPSTTVWYVHDPVPGCTGRVEVGAPNGAGGGVSMHDVFVDPCLVSLFHRF